MLISRIGIQSEKNFRLPVRRARRDYRLAISTLYPAEHEMHGREQRSATGAQLILGYLICRPSNVVVNYSTDGGGGDSLLGTKGSGNC